MGQHEDVEAVLDEVSDLLPWSRRGQVRRELSGHLEDAVAELRTEGWTEEAARAEALRRFGDPAEIGEALRRAWASRTLPLWSLGAAAVLTGCGVAALAATDSQYLFLHLRWIALGAVALAGASLVRTTQLERVALPLYGAVMGLNAIVAVFGFEGPSRCYLRLGSLAIDIHLVSPVLLLAAVAAMLPRLTRARGGTALGAALILGPSLALALWGAESSGMALAAAGGAMTMAAARALRHRLFIAAGILAVLCAVVATSTWWPPMASPLVSGALLLPNSHTDQVFAQGVLSYGAVFALLVTAAAATLGSTLLRIVSASKPSIALFATGITILLAVHAVWNVGWGLGLAPATESGALPLPFMSYGGSHTVLFLAAVGLLVGHHRRSRLVASS